MNPTYAVFLRVIVVISLVTSVSACAPTASDDILSLARGSQPPSNAQPFTRSIINNGGFNW